MAWRATGDRPRPLRNDPLLRVILWWTAIVTGVLLWLPLVRGATQGVSYRWALADGIGGRGIGGDYWVLVLAAPLVLSLLYLGWRGGRQPFHWLLLALHLPLAAAVTYAAWTDPQGFRFEGATVGIDVSLAVIGPLLFCGFAAAAMFWVIRDLRAGRSRFSAPWVWTRAARIRLLLLFALIPVETLLFRSGAIDSPRNMIGVALVFWQWIIVNRMFAAVPSPS
jgi:hypothetical protein